MSSRPSIDVGLMLMAEPQWLDLLGPVCESSRVDRLVVTPETTWRPVVGEVFAEPNDYHARFRGLAERAGKPVVGHGIGYSPGTADPGDASRRTRWRQRLAVEREVFDFAWYTEHLGAAWLGEEHVALPLPLPQDPSIAALVREHLLELRCAAPRVGLENSAFYFALGDPLDEPVFLGECVAHEDLFVLLDLHNLYANGLNLGFEPREWLARLDLRKVEEIHVSGGDWSDPAWFEGASGDGGLLRLDSHDAAVPEPVWELLGEVVPRCANLRAVTLERMEGTVGPADVPRLCAELDRIREVCRSRCLAPTTTETPEAVASEVVGGGSQVDLARLQASLAQALRAADPVLAVRALGEQEDLPARWREMLARAPARGIQLTERLVTNLRFERLRAASALAREQFANDPRRFAQRFALFCREHPPRDWHPIDEARAFEAFST